MASEYDSLLEEEPKESEYDQLLAPEPQEPGIPTKIGRAVVETVKGFFPQSVGQAVEQGVGLLPGARQVIQGYKTLASVALGTPAPDPIHEAIAGIPVVQRIPQIMEAEKTPAGSQERYTAGIGTLADVAMLGAIVKGARPELREVVFGKQPEPAVAPEPPLTAEAEVKPIAPEVAQPVREAESVATAPLLPKEEVIKPVEEVTDASKITSTEGVTQPEVRARVGEEAPLRQPGETAEARQEVVGAAPEAGQVAAVLQPEQLRQELGSIKRDMTQRDMPDSEWDASLARIKELETQLEGIEGKSRNVRYLLK